MESGKTVEDHRLHSKFTPEIGKLSSPCMEELLPAGGPVTCALELLRAAVTAGSLRWHRSDAERSVGSVRLGPAWRERWLCLVSSSAPHGVGNSSPETESSGLPWNASLRRGGIVRVCADSRSIVLLLSLYEHLEKFEDRDECRNETCFPRMRERARK